MKILKWLKRETDDSLDPLKSTVITKTKTTGQIGGTKAKLNRNESYLKALSKFAKWRQMHLSTANGRNARTLATSINRRHAALQITKKHVTGFRTRASTSKLNEGNIDKDNFLGCCQAAVYEEIQLDLENANSKSASLSAMDTDNEGLYKMRYCNSVIAGLNALEYTVQEYSNNMQASSSESVLPLKISEPEYAIPYEFGEKEATAECSSRGKLMVTDLDKSQDSIEIDEVSEVKSFKANKFETREKECIVELLKCSLRNIKTSNFKICCNLMNGQLQNGEIDAIEISFLQMKHNLPYGLKNNYNILRKLRHPNILLLMGTTSDENHSLNGLIFEAVNLTLYEQIHSLAHPTPVETCQKHALQLSNAVLYLHRCGIIHTNICSKNILLCGIGIYNSIKLAGFEFYATLDTKDSAFCEREMNAQHFYQAPELFDETQSHLMVNFQTDVYGICITLWEMLNFVIPYAQFSRNELSKVFTLKNTQLPVYEKNRYVPFKHVLEKGLQIEADRRYANVLKLKQAINEVDLHSKNYDHFNSLPLSVEHGEEFTSTMKKRKTSPVKNLTNVNDNVQNYELTPNKRYSVNIIINSKCSPNCRSVDKYCEKTEPTTLNLGETLFEECDTFELALNNSLPTNFTHNYNHNNENIAFESMQPRYSLDPYKLTERNSRKRYNRTSNFNSVESVIPPDTEDFFIDDDFSNELNLETNLGLNTINGTNNMAYFK